MDFVRELKTQGRRVFLDLKLYDIGETVKRAVSKWAARSQPERGAALLHLLAAYARTKGYTTFVAVTMGSNARMIEVLRNSGFPWTTTYNQGTLEARLDITRPPAHPVFPPPPAIQQ